MTRDFIQFLVIFVGPREESWVFSPSENLLEPVTLSFL